MLLNMLSKPTFDIILEGRMLEMCSPVPPGLLYCEMNCDLMLAERKTP